ncbi:DNA/RNA non-specific endonuclease [Acetobacter thailandicus]|nr:DNA/RNA non-specific endonuclease [Acetobacter thailandicus]
MMRTGGIFLSGVVFLWGMSTQAFATEGCRALFYKGLVPAVSGALSHGQLLCNKAYATLNSPMTRGPVWSAEWLVEENLEQASRTKREGSFYPDTRVPYGQRGELSDWEKSGWDRGHLAPSGDFAGIAAQQESFALSNIVPQASALNRGAWAGIESVVRGLTYQDGELYVVTGVLFPQTGQKRTGRDGVMVPSALWKAVFDPVADGAAVYLCLNSNTPQCRLISLSQLQQRAGIDVFPSLPESVKTHIMAMPATGTNAYARRVRNKQSEKPGFNWNSRETRWVLRQLRRALKQSLQSYGRG